MSKASKEPFMDANQLREQLAKLHDELADARHVDPQDRELLGQIMGDIRRLLERPAAAADVSPFASLADRLERVGVQFEVDHPSLAASIRRFVDLLGKVGL